eukprot:2418008-Prymnesium_polylepis.1
MPMARGHDAVLAVALEEVVYSVDTLDEVPRHFLSEPTLGRSSLQQEDAGEEKRQAGEEDGENEELHQKRRPCVLRLAEPGRVRARPHWREAAAGI